MVCVINFSVIIVIYGCDFIKLWVVTAVWNTVLILGSIGQPFNLFFSLFMNFPLNTGVCALLSNEISPPQIFIIVYYIIFILCVIYIFIYYCSNDWQSLINLHLYFMILVTDFCGQLDSNIIWAYTTHTVHILHWRLSIFTSSLSLVSVLSLLFTMPFLEHTSRVVFWNSAIILIISFSFATSGLFKIRVLKNSCV